MQNYYFFSYLVIVLDMVARANQIRSNMMTMTAFARKKHTMKHKGGKVEPSHAPESKLEVEQEEAPTHVQQEDETLAHESSPCGPSNTSVLTLYVDCVA